MSFSSFIFVVLAHFLLGLFLVIIWIFWNHEWDLKNKFPSVIFRYFAYRVKKSKGLIIKNSHLLPGGSLLLPPLLCSVPLIQPLGTILAVSSSIPFTQCDLWLLDISSGLTPGMDGDSASLHPLPSTPCPSISCSVNHGHSASPLHLNSMCTYSESLLQPSDLT